jgi:hypothetical protein
LGAGSSAFVVDAEELETMNTLGFLIKPHKFGWWLIAAVMVVYLSFCTIIFFQWINPSLDGRTDDHIAADSTTYIYMADVVRGDYTDPAVLAVLASFPNTFWMPVLFALVLKSNVLIALANLTLFWIAIELFRRSWDIRVGLFLSFLLLNPTTTISLLSVNKEIVDLFIMALFCYFLATGHKWALCLALIASLVNRYEVCVAMLLFFAARSRLSPFRSRRLLTLLFVVLGLSVLLPLLVSQTLNSRFEEASGGGLVALLDTLEIHYLFVLAVVPKILENMFGELLNVSHWGDYSLDDFANSYILFFNNLASFLVVLTLAWKRSFKLSNDLMFFVSIGAVLMSVSLVVQPRYFYFCFVVLCLEAARPKEIQQRKLSALRPAREVAGA